MSTSTNKFMELANETINLADAYTKGTVELTAAQEAIVKAYEKAKEALKGQHKQLDNAEHNAIQDIKRAFADKHEAVNAQSKELKEEFEKECINVGLKTEDIPLSEYQVVQRADKAAKGILGKIGGVGRYIKNGLDG